MFVLKKSFTMLLLTLFFLSSILNYFEVNIEESSEVTNYFIEDSLDFGIQSIFENQSILDKIAGFLEKSQNDGAERFKSMDDAYYIGMILYYLAHFQTVETAQVQTEILNFIGESRNEDGGYGNWEGSKSSMESTYQALELMQSFDKLSQLSLQEANDTLNYIQLLNTSLSGYFPISNWDAPDITSTYRALWAKELISTEFVGLTAVPDSNASNFIEGNYIEPIISDSSGYSEIYGGSLELLASYYAFQSLDILGIPEPENTENVAKYLNDLISITGGVSGYLGSLPTIGYTSIGIQLYIDMLNMGGFDVTELIPDDFLENSINYIVANKIAGLGYSSSDRDDTPELSSTYFALKVLWLVDQEGLLDITPDFTGIFEYVIIGLQPDFGIGNYPGDIPDLERTVQALYIGKMLNNTNWLNPSILDYIEDTYSSTTGGFGFRPNTRPVVKYTYYGIQALRLMNQPLENAYDIQQFIFNSQNEGGGFGETIGSRLSYLTHTYRAIEALNLLGQVCLENIDYDLVLNWLDVLGNADGTYSNYQNFNSTLSSTYRAIQIQTLFGEPIDTDELLKNNLEDYLQPSGGFLSSLNKTNPTIEATFYGVSLSLQLELDVNISKVIEFVYSLFNDDGGFGKQLGFTSTVDSTYYALLLLNLIQSDIELEPENHDLYSEYPNDYFAPMINSGFIPKLDTNTSFYGTYLVNVEISDPESRIKRYWTEVKWTNTWGNLTIDEIITNPNVTVCPIDWKLVLGPYYEEGFLEFRIFAEDNSNNTAYTNWFSLITLDFEIIVNNQKDPIGIYFLYSIGPVFIVIGLVDGIIISVRGKRRK